MSEPAELAAIVSNAHSSIRSQMERRVVGMGEVTDLVLAGILSGGHCLLVGVPGLAKTLLIRTLADLLDLPFSRIQFTPDLMPSDIVGTEVIVEDVASGQRDFRFLQGPVFASVLLADEINRTPPKTQAALMEAMEERQVTTSGERHALPNPFFVLATQNPIEQEGTYPLPAAQLDRFTFRIDVGYPTKAEERRVMRLTTTRDEQRVEKVLDRTQILHILESLRDLRPPDEVVAFATNLARRTRPKSPDAPESVRRFLSWGVGPRGAQALVVTAKAKALLDGRPKASVDDARALAPHVFRHRMIRNFHGEAEGVSTDDLLSDLLASTDTTISGRSVVGG